LLFCLLLLLLHCYCYHCCRGLHQPWTSLRCVIHAMHS
jgi:hypothetical protein